MEEWRRGLSRLREALVQGCNSGKNKVCSFVKCSGGQWARRQAVGGSGGNHGCVQSLKGDPLGKVQGPRFQKAPAGLANCTSWPAVTYGVRHHVFPGVMMMPGGEVGYTVV